MVEAKLRVTSYFLVFHLRCSRSAVTMLDALRPCCNTAGHREDIHRWSPAEVASKNFNFVAVPTLFVTLAACAFCLQSSRAALQERHPVSFFFLLFLTDVFEVLRSP